MNDRVQTDRAPRRRSRAVPLVLAWATVVVLAGCGNDECPQQDTSCSRACDLGRSRPVGGGG